MRKSVFMVIILSVFGAFLGCISLVAQGSVLGLVLLMIWMVSVVVGLNRFAQPKYAKYHKFIS
jgi:hypothetical protein